MMIDLESPRLGYNLSRTPGFVEPSPFKVFPVRLTVGRVYERLFALISVLFPVPLFFREQSTTGDTGDTGTTHESSVHEMLSPSFLIKLASARLVSGSVCAVFFRIVRYFCTNPWLPSTEISILSPPPDMLSGGSHIACPLESDVLTASTITSSVIAAAPFKAQLRACTNPTLNPLQSLTRQNRY